MDKIRNFWQRKKKTDTRQDDETGDDTTADIPTENDVNPDVPPNLSLIDDHGVLIRRRGKATCQDIRDLPPGTRAIIELNDSGQPCNAPACNLLASYLGVLAKDSTMAPISFNDWRSPGLELYKRRLVEEVQVKFAFPPQAQTWIRQAIGTKWRAYKVKLKSQYWDPNKSLEEIIVNVPDGVDALQWATLVTHWNEPQEKARSIQNTAIAKKLKCSHTGGRKTLVRKQQETEITDRLMLWKLNRLRKDGSFVSEEAKQKWELACAILDAKNLTPEDGNLVENENTFRDVMGKEHPGRVRCKGFGVTPSKYYPEASTSSTAASYMSVSSAERFNNLENEVSTMKKTMGQMFSFLKKNMGRGKSKKTAAPVDEEDVEDEEDEDEDEDEEDEDDA